MYRPTTLSLCASIVVGMGLTLGACNEEQATQSRPHIHDHPHDRVPEDSSRMAVPLYLSAEAQAEVDEIRALHDLGLPEDPVLREAQRRVLEAYDGGANRVLLAFDELDRIAGPELRDLVVESVARDLEGNLPTAVEGAENPLRSANSCRWTEIDYCRSIASMCETVYKPMYGTTHQPNCGKDHGSFSVCKVSLVGFWPFGNPSGSFGCVQEPQGANNCVKEES